MKKTTINVNHNKTLRQVMVCSPKNFKKELPINTTEELTFKKTIDTNKLTEEFDCFVSKLKSLGVSVISLPAKADLPQQTFVRDLGFTLNNMLFFGKTNVKTREGEKSAAKSFSNLSDTYEFKQCLEGGDVIFYKNIAFVGISDRTSEEGVEEFKQLLQDDFEIVPLKLKSEILHLDTVLNVVGDIIVVNLQGIEGKFDPYFYSDKVVEVCLAEQFFLPTNFLTISPTTVIANTECKETNKKLREFGVLVEEVSFKEIVKLGGSFRCCSMEIVKE